MKDNSIRAQIALAVFAALSISILVGIWSDYLELELFLGFREFDIPDEATLTTNDIRAGFVALTHFVLILGSIFAFLYWFRRAYANLKTQIDIRFADNMAVWGFLIPFLNLFRPVQIALDINSSTRRKLKKLDSGYSSAGVGAVIGLWWGTYLISSFVDNISMRMTLRDDDSLNVLIENLRVSIFSGVLDFVAALATIWVIYTLFRQENALMEAVADREFSKMIEDQGIPPADQESSSEA